MLCCLERGRFCEGLIWREELEEAQIVCECERGQYPREAGTVGASTSDGLDDDSGRGESGEFPRDGVANC